VFDRDFNTEEESLKVIKILQDITSVYIKDTVPQSCPKHKYFKFEMDVDRLNASITVCTYQQQQHLASALSLNNVLCAMANSMQQDMHIPVALNALQYKVNALVYYEPSSPSTTAFVYQVVTNGTVLSQADNTNTNYYGEHGQELRLGLLLIIITLAVTAAIVGCAIMCIHSCKKHRDHRDQKRKHKENARKKRKKNKTKKSGHQAITTMTADSREIEFMGTRRGSSMVESESRHSEEEIPVVPMDVDDDPHEYMQYTYEEEEEHTFNHNEPDEDMDDDGDDDDDVLEGIKTAGHDLADLQAPTSVVEVDEDDITNNRTDDDMDELMPSHVHHTHGCDQLTCDGQETTTATGTETTRCPCSCHVHSTNVTNSQYLSPNMAHNTYTGTSLSVPGGNISDMVCDPESRPTHLSAQPPPLLTDTLDSTLSKLMFLNESELDNEHYCIMQEALVKADARLPEADEEEDDDDSEQQMLVTTKAMIGGHHLSKHTSSSSEDDEETTVPSTPNKSNAARSFAIV